MPALRSGGCGCVGYRRSNRPSNQRGTVGFSKHLAQDHKGESNVWLTPPAILSQLGKFDLDPCLHAPHGELPHRSGAVGCPEYTRPSCTILIVDSCRVGRIMADPDLALDVLRKINQDFSAFMVGKGSVSEADTRANLIDKVLVQVLGWPESAITREEHVDRGYIDYSLQLQTRRF